jgi:carbon monoxide dehydrogenase subunit G
MDLSGEYFVPLARPKVWEALRDAAVLRVSIPGCRSLERNADGGLTATVEAGPGDPPWTVALSFADADPPGACRLTLTADAGPAGQARASARLTLAEEGAGTRIAYDAHATAGGKLAELGAAALASQARHLVERFFGTFAARVAEGRLSRAEHAVEHAVGAAAHEVAHVAQEAEEQAEGAAARGVLGGPMMWGVLALAALILALIALRQVG